MATIQYTTYKFNRPSLISGDDYETLKGMLIERPEYNINPPSSFVETFKGELEFLCIGAIGLLIASLDLAEWLNWVGGIPAFLAIFSLLSFAPSMISYLGFVTDRFIYYFKLRRDIIKSSNYAKFANLIKKMKTELNNPQKIVYLLICSSIIEREKTILFFNMNKETK